MASRSRGVRAGQGRESKQGLDEEADLRGDVAAGVDAAGNLKEKLDQIDEAKRSAQAEIRKYEDRGKCTSMFPPFSPNSLPCQSREILLQPSMEELNLISLAVTAKAKSFDTEFLGSCTHGASCLMRRAHSTCLQAVNSFERALFPFITQFCGR